MIVIIHRLFGDYRAPLFKECLLQEGEVWLFHHHNKHYEKVLVPDSFGGETRGFCNWLPGAMERRGFFFNPLLVLAAAWKGRKARMFILEGESNILNNLLLVPLLWLMQKPYVWWTAGQPFLPRITLRRRLANPLFRLLMQRARRIACYSHSGRRFLLEQGFRPSQVGVAQNALHESLIQHPENQSAAERLITDHQWTEHFRLTYIGALTTIKRPEILIQAVAKFRQQTQARVVILFVGAGPERDNLGRLAEELGVECHFAGRHSMEISGRYVSASQLVVVPGRGGLSINHAMMLGRPVVCGRSDGTELDLVLHGETGWYLDPLTADSLADCLVGAWKSQERLIQMGQRAEQHVNRIARTDLQASALLCRDLATTTADSPARIRDDSFLPVPQQKAA